MVTAFASGISLFLGINSAFADPWDVKFLGKWGSTCLLSSNIGCVDSSSQDLNSQDPPSQDPNSQDPLSQPLDTDKIGDGMFWGIWGIASDGSSIYTTDVLNHRIQKFETDGTFVTKWGKEGEENGEFNKPSGIAADSQYVYVVDHNNRIQVFNKDGEFVMVIGSSGSDPGKLNNPEDVEVDSDGRIYVADSGNNRIQVFYPNDLGGIAWGSKGTGPGQFDYPQGISVPAPGHVYVADSHNDRVQYFQLASSCPQGTTEVQSGVCFVKEWGKEGSGDGQFKRPADISASNEVIYVVDGNNNRIQLFTKDGTFIKKFGSECLIKTGLKPSGDCKGQKGTDADSSEIGNGQFKYPAGVTVLSNTVYVADNFNDRVQVFDIERGQLPSAKAIIEPTNPLVDTNQLGNQLDLDKGPLSVIKADAGNDRTINSGVIVVLNGEKSEPKDGSLEFNWRQTSGSQKVDLKNAETAKPEFDTSQITENTKLSFELKVTDKNNQANSDTDTVDVNVVGEKENQKPKADAGNGGSLNEGESAELDGTKSQDEDGSIVSFAWASKDCDDGPKGDLQNSLQAKATFVAPQISSSSTSCSVELKVTDNEGDTDSDTVQIKVNKKSIPNTNPNLDNVQVNSNLDASQ